MIQAFCEARRIVQAESPLIHCITNPISINDCANAVLALGAKPIMAEHPKEVGNITAVSAALAVNLGNITDARAESIFLSGKMAADKGIRSVIDVVGITCSDFRMELAKRYIDECSPSVIKGNLSEIKAVAGAEFESVGIDVSIKDAVTKEDEAAVREAAVLVKNYAMSAGAVVTASGAVDIISDGNEVYLVENGMPELARVTGTGCMLNVITGTYLSAAKPVTAAVLAAVTLGVCGELADKAKGMGTYRVSLIDKLSTLDDKTLEQKMRVKKLHI